MPSSSSPLTGAPVSAPTLPAAAPPLQPPAKLCFNSHCKDPLPSAPPPSPQRRKGWRLRSGEIAELCERCSCVYELGSFCERFHSEIAGWRNCETCGKRIHCGCIASATTYVLLDAGGVDCVACARKSIAMASNQILASPMHMHQHASDRRDFAAKSWRPLSGPFPGQWRQTPHMWNMTSAQSDLQQRLSYEFDRPNNIEKVIPGGRHSAAHEKKSERLPDRIASSSLGTVPRDKFMNGNRASDPVSSGTFRRDEGNANGLHDPGNVLGGHDPISLRRPVYQDLCSTTGANATLCINPQLSSTTKEETTSILTGYAAPFPLTNGTKGIRFPSNQPPSQVSPSAKQFYNQGVVDADSHAQMLNERPNFDGRTRVPNLSRYWPRITDQELQKISGDTNSVITPLFEKMLSASDAGRIGRLVLPKKCAEAYFPTISQPEGLPLKVQDANGKEWAFQFRFWPNNNSRMYVLEGVTPCIQSMQLQAGDIVTFSRVDPEGKLIMGFRKASSIPSEQESQINKSSNGFSTSPEGDNKSPVVDFVANISFQETKSNAEPNSTTIMPDQATCSEVLRPEFIQKDEPGVKSSQVSFKRKSNTPGSKIKRLKIEKDDSIELKVTWEEAQELLRPPPNVEPAVVKIDGYEFEEYEQAPVMGRRPYFTKDRSGENLQWVQCEDCSKLRKLPIDVLLPARWTCSDNVWDPNRNTCLSAEELSFEQLMDLIHSKAGASKRSKVRVKRENGELVDGLGTLANLAILGEGENLSVTSQQTTRHPRHRPGCTCIVCIQPPSGKGPKHKPHCTCSVCATVKRRFRTLMLRREGRHSDREAEKVENAETSGKPQETTTNPQADQLVQPSSGPLPNTQAVNGTQQALVSNNPLVEEGTDCRRTSPSPIKAPQIDLNIQPEREEEPSPQADAGSIRSFLHDAAI